MNSVPGIATLPRPLKDNILVLRDEPEAAAGRFITPENCRKEQATGRAMAVGREATIKPGDRIAFARYSAQPVRTDGTDYLMVREADVLAVITDEE